MGSQRCHPRLLPETKPPDNDDVYRDLKFQQSDDTAQWTRLLRLLPNLSARERIQCTIRNVKLPRPELRQDVENWRGESQTSSMNDSEQHSQSKNPVETVYDALSYVWGEDRDHRWIEVNNKPFKVRPNLWHFLDFARNKLIPNDLQDLWVDAICINQYDDDEKSYQVRGMGHIFSAAAFVVVWLDQQSPQLDVLFNFSRRYNVYLSKYECLTDEIRKESLLQFLKQPETVGSGLTLGTLIKLIKSFFDLEYWHRAWTIQEWSVATQAIIVTFTEAISFLHLACVVTSLIEIKEREALVGHMYVYAGAWAIQRDGVDISPLYRSHIISATQRLRFAQDLRCTLPSDHVYSQLALIDHGWEFEIDYKEDAIDLAARTLIFCCQYDTPDFFELRDIYRRRLGKAPNELHCLFLLTLLNRAFHNPKNAAFVMDLRNSSFATQVNILLWPQELDTVTCVYCKQKLTTVDLSDQYHVNHYCCLTTGKQGEEEFVHLALPERLYESNNAAAEPPDYVIAFSARNALFIAQKQSVLSSSLLFEPVHACHDLEEEPVTSDEKPLKKLHLPLLTFIIMFELTMLDHATSSGIEQRYLEFLRRLARAPEDSRR